MAESTTIRVTVHYFGATRDAAATASERLDVPMGTTAHALRERLTALHPSLAPLWPHVRWAVDTQYVDGHATLRDGADVALIPPVAGGATSDNPDIRAELVDLPIDIESLRRWGQRDDLGAVAVFVGMVRNRHDGRDVSHLHYEAYRPMAERLLREIAHAAHARFTLGRVAVVHRLGRLDVGDTAVAVVASAEHRAATFDAPRWIMDAIKSDVPIFKHEYHTDGSDTWVGLPTTDTQRLR